MRVLTPRRDLDDEGSQSVTIQFVDRDELIGLLAVLDRIRFGTDEVKPARHAEQANELREQLYDQLGWTSRGAATRRKES